MPIDYNFEPKGLRSNLGWYWRRLPHFDAGETAQFFTFRLFDSLPAAVVKKYREQTKDQGDEGQVLFRKNIEKCLDNGWGSCFLRDPRIAELVVNALLFHHAKLYLLIAWVIMPNHIHFLARPLKDIEIATVAHSIKSYTAHEANKILGRTGQFWQPEPFDRYIRNAKHYVNVIRYIENNPVKAGLCPRPEDWPYSSARTRLER